MSASEKDVNLVVIHQGQTEYWAGLKSCGNVFLDIRFGLYSEPAVPDLSWIKGTMWEEMLSSRKSPLKKPIYGDLIINFDEKTIIDATGYGSPFYLRASWLKMTWDIPKEAPVSKASLKDHLAHGRVKYFRMGDPRGEAMPLDKKMAVVKEHLEQRGDDYNYWPVAVQFDLPSGWVCRSQED